MGEYVRVNLTCTQLGEGGDSTGSDLAALEGPARPLRDTGAAEEQGPPADPSQLPTEGWPNGLDLRGSG